MLKLKSLLTDLQGNKLTSQIPDVVGNYVSLVYLPNITLFKIGIQLLFSQHTQNCRYMTFMFFSVRTIDEDIVEEYQHEFGKKWTKTSFIID